MSYVKCQKWNVKCQMSYVKCQKRKVKYQMSNVSKVKLLSERLYGVPPVIFPDSTIHFEEFSINPIYFPQSRARVWKISFKSQIRLGMCESKVVIFHKFGQLYSSVWDTWPKFPTYLTFNRRSFIRCICKEFCLKNYPIWFLIMFNF